MTTPEGTLPTREPRPLRNIPLDVITEIAGVERMTVDDMTRLLLSFATFKWERGWKPTATYTEGKTVRLLPGGVSAVQALADRENCSWGEMASRLVAFGVDRWETGWRKDDPGAYTDHAVFKPGTEPKPKPEAPANVIPYQRFDHELFERERTDSRSPKPRYGRRPTV